MSDNASIERSVVVLADAWGNPVGSADKQAAHRPPGLLHLAFSVVLYRRDLVLLQQRSAEKYHFPLHWTNACCSHPAPGEDVLSSAERRVIEELGCQVSLHPAGRFTYRAICPASGLIEHEFDYVFVGELDEEPRPEPSEIAATQWIRPGDVFAGLITGSTTPWLIPALRFAEGAIARRNLVTDRTAFVVALTGTGTAVGKTYVATRLIADLDERVAHVVARKPLQSGTDEPGADDAFLLAAATGEDERVVCADDRRFPLDMAPPMAAAVLGLPMLNTRELVGSLDVDDADLCVLELAGGLRSPFAADGDGLDYLQQVDPDLVLLVAPSDLGALNAVRLCIGYLDRARTVVYLNYFDADVALHEHNRKWLSEEGLHVVTNRAQLVDFVIERLAAWMSR